MRSMWLVAALALAGCVTTQQPAEIPVWARADCRLMEGDIELETEFERAKMICGPRAEAAAVAGTAGMPVGYGIAGAIASGIERGMTQTQISRATAISCMAEQGYMHRRPSEHEAVCTELVRARTPRPKKSTGR